MGRFALLCAVVAAVVAVLGVAGNGTPRAAAGNPAKPDPPGQQQTPPGQAAKADDEREKPTPPGQEQTPPGQAAKDPAEQPAATPAAEGAASNPGTESGPPKDAPKEAHGTPSSASSPRSGHGGPASAPGQSSADKPAAATKTKEPAPATRSATAQKHVILCHRTGSDSNPYVVINVSVAAWLHGHSTHPPLHGRNDILLDPDAKPGEKLPESACVDHGGVITSDPSDPTSSSKPADPGTSVGDPGASASGDSRPDDPRADDPGGMSSARHTQASTGGVATARRLSQTAVRATLPFTGLPLWIVLIASAALVGGGLALRRAPVPQASGRRAATRGTGLYWRRDGR